LPQTALLHRDLGLAFGAVLRSVREQANLSVHLPILTGAKTEDVDGHAGTLRELPGSASLDLANFEEAANHLGIVAELGHARHHPHATLGVQVGGQATDTIILPVLTR
jgi:hypothetical protein